MIKATFLALVAFACASAVGISAPNGVLNDTPASRGMGLGGAETAAAQSPLEAISANPAALGEIAKPAADLGVVAGIVDGDFHNRANRDGASLSNAGALPNGAVSIPAGPLRFGLGVYAMSMLEANWTYRDAPGGLDGATTYGDRTQKSEILLLRIPLGVAWKVNDQLDIGGSFSLLYNKNELNAPYIFQSQPVLRGAKTLLDLQTDGFGWNFQAGVLWKPLSNLRFGLSYITEARVHTYGTATGNANVQLKNIGLGAARSDFAYDAEVTNVFPQTVSAGLVWQPVSRLSVDGQVDWLNWQDAFHTLGVHLKNGSNADLNGLVGANRLDDTIPLDWRNQFVFRIGLEYELATDWTVRTGYSYAPNPVPGTTLTPLTAAIAEHTIGAGIGYHHGPYKLDLGWQWALPTEAHAGRSDLLSGEYSNSSVKVTSNWLAMTAGVEF
jgi:long-chain fatty acid transport protein